MDPFDLSGRVGIIMRGSRGIGFAIAEGLAGAGAISGHAGDRVFVCKFLCPAHQACF